MADVRLKYNGKNGEYINGIPARDLDDNDMSWLVFRNGITTDELIDNLTSRGVYSEEKVQKYKTKKEDIQPIEENE